MNMANGAWTTVALASFVAGVIALSPGRALAAPAQELDFVGQLGVVCSTPGFLPATRDLMHCDDLVRLSPADHKAAQVTPWALRGKIGADPCDAVAALVDADETQRVLDAEGPSSRFFRARGDLESVCALPQESTRQVVVGVCAEVERRPFVPDPILTRTQSALLGKKPLTKDEKATLDDVTQKLSKAQADFAAAKVATRQGLGCGPLPALTAPTVALVRGKPSDAACAVVRSESGPEAKKLQLRCGQRAQSAGVTDILIPAMQGLGDFLQARAKEELVAFALSTLGKNLCRPTNAQPLNADAMQNVCKVLFATNEDGTLDLDSPNLDAIGNLSFGASLSKDLLGLPARVVPLVGVKDLPDGAALETILLTLVQQLQQLATGTPTDAYKFMKDLEQKLAGPLKTPTVQCSFTDPNNPPSVACVTMLFMSFAAKAGDLAQPGDPSAGANIEHLNQWGKAAIDYYCQTYGKTGETTNGQCLIGVQGEETWTVLSDWEKAFGDFADRLNSAVQKLKADRSNAASLATLAEDAAVVADTFAEFANATLTGAEALGLKAKGKTTPKALTTIKPLLELEGQILHAASDALGKDFAKLAAALRSILASDLLKSQMSPEFRASLLFFLDLSTAKDRDTARKMIEDAAAPVGTYKEKYAGKGMLTINGFVGVTGGYRARFTQQSGLADGDSDGLKEIGVTAPVGLDWTFVSGKSAHFGLFLSVIDPLAIDPANKKGQVMNGVLAPGLFLRLGLFGSPVAVVLGARTQPVLESPNDTCGADGKATCWKGQFSALIGIAVDVPIVTLVH